MFGDKNLKEKLEEAPKLTYFILNERYELSRFGYYLKRKGIKYDTQYNPTPFLTIESKDFNDDIIKDWNESIKTIYSEL